MLEEIQKTKQREESAIFDHCEGIVAGSLAGLLPSAPSLTDEQRVQVAVFVRWCTSASVRYLPSKPTTVAAFILGQKSIGVAAPALLDQVLAIEALHDHYGFANPVATFAARSALAHIATLEAILPPRSWTDKEKLLFPLLPIEIRAVFGRRESEREKAITRLLGEKSSLISKLRAAEPAKENDSCQLENVTTAKAGDADLAHSVEAAQA